MEQNGKAVLPYVEDVKYIVFHRSPSYLILKFVLLPFGRNILRTVLV